jgi:phage gp29-like protein
LTATNLVGLKATAPATRRKARYNDALTRTAAKRAAVALGPLVERIHGMIQTATGPDDLKRRLVAMYRAAPARELAKVFERTNILANLAGRHDLILEL